jgi:hypothetical protein
MSSGLLRGCLDCRTAVRGKPRCRDCQAKRDRVKDQAKRARRPDLNRNQEIRRRREAVAAWRLAVGDWCPGVPELGRGAHPAAHLTADHLVEVAAGGAESGPLVVRCGPCNSARSANVWRQVLTTEAPTTPRQPNGRLHRDGDDPGPVAA